MGLVKALVDAGWAVIGVIIPKCSQSKNPEICNAWIPADLSILYQNSDHLKEFVEQVCSAEGGSDLTAIIHNAALQRTGTFEELSTADWDDTIAVNLMAPVAINKAFIENIKKQKGSIIHIGSIHRQLTKPGFTAYATSKAAIAGLTQAMAVELGGSVRVNAIEPAAIATPMLKAGFADNPIVEAELSACHPTGNIGRPEDVARAVLFLLEPANRFLNGCVLALSGGIHNRLHDPS